MYVPPNLSVLSFPFTLATLADLHQTGARCAITNLEMPAMSPTMTEGGIASWKTKEGASFSAGEVLLEIVGTRCSFSVGRDFTVELMYPRQETDKATIDVEAQERRYSRQDLGAFVLFHSCAPCMPLHTRSHTQFQLLRLQMVPKTSPSAESSRSSQKKATTYPTWKRPNQ
jgi:hypothetical protein